MPIQENMENFKEMKKNIHEICRFTNDLLFHVSSDEMIYIIYMEYMEYMHIIKNLFIKPDA